MKILEKIIEYGLYLFVFLLPWQTRLIFREGNLNGYWEYGTISIYATEILLWAIFLLTAVWWLLKKSEIRNSKSETNSKFKIQNSKLVFWFLGFFVLWSMLSIFWSGSRSVALQAWIRLSEGIGLFLVLRIAKFDVIKLTWALVVSAVIQAGLGIWQFLSQATFASKWLGMAFHDPVAPGTFVVETALRRWLRAYGSLPHPNMLAGFLAVAMFFSIWIYQKLDYGLKKLLLPVAFAILALGLLVTFSKSVVIAFLVALIFSWVATWIGKQAKENKINLLKFTLIFLAITTIFSAVFWEPVSTRIYGQDRLEIKSTTERLNYFDQAWQLVKKHPLLGVGLGNYTLAVHNEINLDLKSWDYQPVHNVYLLILTEVGIVGLILWLTPLAFVIFKNFKTKLPVTGYPLLVTLLFIGLFDHYLWTLYFGVMFFWLNFGLIKEKTLFDRSLYS